MSQKHQTLSDWRLVNPCLVWTFCKVAGSAIILLAFFLPIVFQLLQTAYVFLPVLLTSAIQGQRIWILSLADEGNTRFLHLYSRDRNLDSAVNPAAPSWYDIFSVLGSVFLAGGRHFAGHGHLEDLPVWLWMWICLPAYLVLVALVALLFLAKLEYAIFPTGAYTVYLGFVSTCIGVKVDENVWTRTFWLTTVAMETGATGLVLPPLINKLLESLPPSA